jgi:hypothetical protein
VSTGAEVVGHSAGNGTRKRCACSADLNRWSIRSRLRVGRCEFSARLFNSLCRRCSLFGNALRIAGGWLASLSVITTRGSAPPSPSSTRCRKRLGGYLIPSVLDQDVQHDAVLVNGSPQPVTFATDLQRNFVQMPLVACSHSSSTQPCRKCGSELGAPLADGLVADDDPAFREEILNVTQAKMKAKVQPDGVSDDLGRETVAPIRRLSAGSATDIRRGLSPITAQVDNSRSRATYAHSRLSVRFFPEALMTIRSEA